MTADHGHWAEGLTYQGQEVAMDPSILIGTRKEFTALDFGGLDDLGWQVTPIPEPTTVLGVSALGLIGAWGVRRRSTRQPSPAARERQRHDRQHRRHRRLQQHRGRRSRVECIVHLSARLGRRYVGPHLHCRRVGAPRAPDRDERDDRSAGRHRALRQARAREASLGSLGVCRGSAHRVERMAPAGRRRSERVRFSEAHAQDRVTARADAATSASSQDGIGSSCACRRTTA